jgi:hypothetical protein
MSIATVSACLVFSVLACHPATQTSGTFHVQGKVTSPWDSMERKNVLVPQNKLVFRGQKAVNRDRKDTYARIPRAEVTFRNGQFSKTIVVDQNGIYQIDLPFGLYKMTVIGPTIGTRSLTPLARSFVVTSPGQIVLNADLYFSRDSCDTVQSGEDRKNVCGGEDVFPVPLKNGIPLTLYVRFPARGIAYRGLVYTTDPVGMPDVPVFVAYNLFSMTADEVTYDSATQALEARGNVVFDDGYGHTHHSDSVKFRIENGKAVSIP